MVRNQALFVAMLIPLLMGCAASGVFPTGQVTDVRLDENDFRVVATNVTGEASAGYVLGVSGAFSGEARTLAVARVSGSDFLYASALDELWSAFEAEYGDLGDRALALTNVRVDADALNLLFYTRSTISIRADVVEFR